MRISRLRTTLSVKVYVVYRRRLIEEAQRFRIGRAAYDLRRSRHTCSGAALFSGGEVGGNEVYRQIDSCYPQS